MTRWNVVVTEQTDHELRHFLATIGENKKGALSQFIEEAVKLRLQEMAQSELSAAEYGSHSGYTGEYTSGDFSIAEEQLAALEREGL